MADKKYTVEPFSVEKIMAADGAMFNKYVKLMHSCFEIDITDLKQKIKTAKQEGKGSVSVLACLFYCYARTLDRHREVLALRGKGNKLFKFEEADAFFPFEIKQDGKKILWHKVIRAINKKTIFELEDDLKSLASVRKEVTPAERFFFKLPWFIRNWFYNILMNNPRMRKDYGGNVYFSSTIHSTTKNNNFAYGIPSHFHTTGMFIGTYKVINNENGLNTKSYLLGVTLSLDHIISDGPMLAKLIRDFVYQLENFTI